MKCNFPDCLNNAVAKGFCHGHYKQLKRGLPMKPINENHSEARKRYAKKYKKTKTRCKVEGCETTTLKRGYCQRHYMQLFRGNPLTIEYNRKPSRRTTVGCSVDGCKNPHSAKGFCSHHYYSIYYKQKNKKYGKVNAMPKMRGFPTNPQ